jgi:hypothetical protein
MPEPDSVRKNIAYVEDRPRAQARSSYHEAAPHPDLLRIGRLPVHFLALATLSFAAGTAACPFVAQAVAVFFYQPEVLALVHTFTLGWITAAIMGVMYRYVPALTRQPIRYPRLGMWQFWLYVIGTVGMIAHFANNIWAGTWSSAAVVIISVAMFAANMVPCLYPRLGKGVAETGMLLAIVMLLVAGSVGFVLALNKSYGFLRSNVFTDIGGHVAFAALGWVTLTICAVSYRMLPAFLLPKIQLPRSAIWQLWTFAAATVALGITLLAGLPGESFWSVMVALSLIAYMVTIARQVRSRRMPIDFTTAHAIAGILWLVGAIAAGVAVSITGPTSVSGERLACAYGTLGLLGWVSNFIIGMSYQLFPGFVGRVRTGFGWPAATIAELSIKRTRPFVFVAFNAGVAAAVTGFASGSTGIARLGAWAIAAAGLVYSAVTLWTLSYAYRRSLPAAAHHPLRIIPS